MVGSEFPTAVCCGSDDAATSLLLHSDSADDYLDRGIIARALQLGGGMAHAVFELFTTHCPYHLRTAFFISDDTQAALQAKRTDETHTKSLAAAPASSLIMATSASDTVGELLERVSGVVGAHPSLLSLSHGGEALAAESSATVASCDGALSVAVNDDFARAGHLAQNSTIAQETGRPAAAITVALPASLQPTFGQDFTLAVSADATVSTVLSALGSALGMPAEKMSLRSNTLGALTAERGVTGIGTLSLNVDAPLGGAVSAVSVALPPALNFKTKFACINAYFESEALAEAGAAGLSLSSWAGRGGDGGPTLIKHPPVFEDNTRTVLIASVPLMTLSLPAPCTRRHSPWLYGLASLLVDVVDGCSAYIMSAAARGAAVESVPGIGGLFGLPSWLEPGLLHAVPRPPSERTCALECGAKASTSSSGGGGSGGSGKRPLEPTDAPPPKRRGAGAIASKVEGR